MFRMVCVAGFVLCAIACVAQQPVLPHVAARPSILPAVLPSSDKIFHADKIVERKSYASVRAICEDLPRKPDRGNRLAAIPDNEWLRKHVCGCSLEVSGRVAEIRKTAATAFVKFVDQEENWRHYTFTYRISATCDTTVNDVSDIELGDSVTLKGTITQMTIVWGIERHGSTPRGQIRLELDVPGAATDESGPGHSSDMVLRRSEPVVPGTSPHLLDEQLLNSPRR
jgi:hypothetical protein